jgi:hypothetical protein
VGGWVGGWVDRIYVWKWWGGWVPLKQNSVKSACRAGKTVQGAWVMLGGTGRKLESTNHVCVAPEGQEQRGT